MTLIKNYLNYIGSKDRLIPIIKSNLDTSKSIFVDMFCGSNTVPTNCLDLPYKQYISNDGCWQLIELHKWILNTPLEVVFKRIDAYIEGYKLSKTNKEGFIKARQVYNEFYNRKDTFEPALFFCLIMHSFNYSIHLNSSGGFSAPSGYNRSSFSNTMRNKLVNYKKAWEGRENDISLHNIKSSIQQVKTLIGNDSIKNTMFYTDPPYLSSDSSYSRIHGLKWTEDEERELYNTLDYINDFGGSFMLSNVIENNGKFNNILYDFIRRNKKYRVIDLSVQYNNCNYQRKNNGKTKEVLVVNY